MFLTIDHECNNLDLPRNSEVTSSVCVCVCGVRTKQLVHNVLNSQYVKMPSIDTPIPHGIGGAYRLCRKSSLFIFSRGLGLRVDLSSRHTEPQNRGSG